LEERAISRAGLVGVAVALAALLLEDFVLVRENRLAPGISLSVFEVLAVWQWGLLLAGPVVLALISLRSGRREAGLGMVVILLLVVALLWFQGAAAAKLSMAGTFTRISIGPGLWLSLLGVFIIFIDMMHRAKPGRVAKSCLAIAFFAGILAFTLAGVFDSLSLVLEFAGRRDRFFLELLHHLFIAGLSVGLSAVIGLPLGLILFKYARLRTGVFAVLNIVQTVPSLALFGLLIAPLAFLSNEIALLRDLGVRGIGWAPAVIALTLYGLLPIVRNTFSGFEGVDKGVIEAGRGMGMGPSHMFLKVELPLAAPIILNGLRIASVQNIGNTAVAALIGAGGFGVFIFQGLGQSAIDLVLLGAVPTILLAVAADGLFQLVIKFFSPGGLS